MSDNITQFNKQTEKEKRDEELSQNFIDEENKDGNQVEEYVEQLASIKDGEINEWLNELAKINSVRLECNEKCKQIREKAKDRGIKSTDLNAIYARFKMDPIERHKRDAAIQRGNKCMKEQRLFDFGD